MRATVIFKRTHRKILLIIVVLMFLYYTLKSIINIDSANNDVVDRNSNEKFYVDTPGCKMPSFPIMNNYIAKFVERPQPIPCGVPLVISDDNSLWINLNEQEIMQHYGLDDLHRIKCSYQPYTRLTDYKVNISDAKVWFKYEENVKIEDEFVTVECFDEDGNSIYRNDIAFVPFKEEVEQICDNIVSEDEGRGKLNVMILGLDSISRLNFHRQMRLTAKQLVDDLEAIELFGYNKLGLNTFPNLVPALTGYHGQELDMVCLQKSTSTYDDCPFIWKQYAGAGYRTVYTEDADTSATFNIKEKGFVEQPTHYYLRTLFSHTEPMNTFPDNDKSILACVGGRTQTDILLEHMRKFYTKMKNKLTFSLFWEVAVTHDKLNYPTLLDLNYTDFLSEMEFDNYLNKTFLIVMSDHGLRFGDFRKTYQGAMEDRQPFIFLVPPKWFKNKYPIAYKNLQINKHRLTTHFDLHETLVDILDLPLNINDQKIKERTKIMVGKRQLGRGISLFLEIPPTRTCESAGISLHLCTCHDNKPLDIFDPKAVEATKIAIQNINDQLKSYPQCKKLSIWTIKGASLFKEHEGTVEKIWYVPWFLAPKANFRDINVKFKTKPGDAEFDATVRLVDNGEHFVAGISRTNMYRNQSHCVDEPKLKIFCYC